ncbi:hypothetical protein N9937_02235 [bacterium]|nr:hypothetical protein [bacterium]
MAKFQSTGALNHVNKHAPEYNFATGEDFTQAMYVIAKANTMFEELPSQIRSRFENKPESFLSFMQNESNRPEWNELGLTDVPYKKEPTGEQTQATPASEPQIEASTVTPT